MADWGDFLVPGIYFALFLAWLWLAATVPQLLPRPPVPSKELRKVVLGARVTAIVFSVDALYWMMANFSRHGFIAGDEGRIDDFLREPWRVLLIKSLLLIAAVSFFFVLKASSKAFLNKIESLYFSRFVEDTWDAVCITDIDGKVLHWNGGAVKLFGFAKSSVLGKNLKEFLIPQNLQDEMDRVWEEIRSSRLAQVDHHALRHTSSGRMIPIDVSISPIFEGPIFKGFFGIMRKASDGPRFRYFKDVRGPQRSDPYAFVIMPFSTSVVKKEVLTEAVSKAVEDVGLKAVRGDTEPRSEQIVDQIYGEIVEAKIIIADLTDSNPNVFYELGIAHGLDRPVVQIINKNSGSLPFDIQGIRTIIYDPDDLPALREDLAKALKRHLETA